MNHSPTKRRIWYGLLRIAAVFFGIAVGSLSVEFSQKGFIVLRLGTDSNASLLLALFVIYLQLVFNRGTKNPTLYYLGLGSYLYSLGTNIAGMYNLPETVALFQALRGDAASMAALAVSEILRAIVVLAFAIGIDLGPEAVIVWGLFDDDVTLGDFVSSLAKGTPLKLGVEQDKNTDRHTYRRTDIQTDGHTDKTILNYAIRNIKGGKFPSVRTIADRFGIDKNRVSKILRPHRNKYEKR